MLSTAPAQVLLKNSMQRGRIAATEIECDSEDDVAPMMKDRIVIAEIHVVGADDFTLILFGQDLARIEHLGDEHRSCSFRRRRQKVQILPHRAANRARNPDIVFEPGPTTSNGVLNERLDDRAALTPELASITLFPELMRLRGVSDDQAAKASVSDQNVGAESEDKVGYIVLSRREHGIGKCGGRRRLEEEIGRSANSKRRIRSEWLTSTYVPRVETCGETLECLGIGAGHGEDKRNNG